MQVQVVLDRLGFTPGVVDGKEGMSTTNALRGFQEANGLPVSGELDDATRAKLAQWAKIPATRVVTIPKDWGDTPYQAIPDEPEDQARLARLDYESLDERLAERFHTTLETLEMLNPGGVPAGTKPLAAVTQTPGPEKAVEASGAEPPPATIFRPGQQVRVPNIGSDRLLPGVIDNAEWASTLAALGVGSEQPEASRVVVSKAAKTLKAYDKDGRLIALFTVSTGSSRFPLPLGEWKIKGEAYNPPYTYDSDVLGKRGEDEEHQLPPGPNSPVGVVWIDLSKDHYGIHGTPDPETIGRAQSSGCVRLTNWDAARLALMVSPRTEVLFEA